MLPFRSSTLKDFCIKCCHELAWSESWFLIFPQFQVQTTRMQYKYVRFKWNLQEIRSTNPGIHIPKNILIQNDNHINFDTGQKRPLLLARSTHQIRVYQTKKANHWFDLTRRCRITHIYMSQWLVTSSVPQSIHYPNQSWLIIFWNIEATFSWIFVIKIRTFSHDTWCSQTLAAKIKRVTTEG